MNLALEEYCLRHLDPANTYLLFYVNRPAIVIGRNQNPLQEINAAYTAAKGIPIIRRISGGGAVYHDHGNLNVSIITPYRREYLHHFGAFTAPVIAALQRMGVPAATNARNDIEVRGKKISGTAQFSSGTGILTHGTLLFDADLVALRAALAASASPVDSRAVPSVRSPVANVSSMLTGPVPMSVFAAEIRRAVAAHHGGAAPHPLADCQWRAVAALAREKYRSWDWNVGRSPRFRIRRSGRIGAGAVDMVITVENGRVRALEAGVGNPDPAAIRLLERSLVGRRYRKEEMAMAFSDGGLDRIFRSASPLAFAELVTPV